MARKQLIKSTERYTVAEVAAMKDISKPKIYQLITQGIIQVEYVGHLMVIGVNELDKIIKRPRGRQVVE